MKLLTLNTHSWMEENPLAKCKQLAQVILEEQYDVIALQEVNQAMTEDVASSSELRHFSATSDTIPIKKDNFALKLIEILNQEGVMYYWSWQSSHIGYDQFDEGIAILSKYPINKTHSFLASSANEYDDYRTRRILGIETTINQEIHHFYSIHLSWWKNEKNQLIFLNEYQQLMHALSEIPAKEKIFLMGDFNNETTIPDEGYALLQKDWLDTYTLAQEKLGSHTVEKQIDGWSDNLGKLRIDYIFCSQKIAVTQYEVIFNEHNRPIISDHFGISVIIE